ncbi:MAG: GTP-binding protein [Clostridia bacterium]|nr:GTP-binding protein [Clostridia bacterium]
MTKIDIYSGFLGAGKTTLIRKMLNEAYAGEKLVLIENEFGEIGIDGGFLQEAGVEIREMNSGCICCSLVGDFGEALRKVVEEYAPDRIIIEPSGVGKLSDVIRAVRDNAQAGMVLNAFTTVVDAGKAKMYMKNFGEFFNDQIEHAGTIVMSHADAVSAEKLETAVALVRAHNESAVIITTPITQLDGKALLEAIERRDSLQAAVEHLMHEEQHHHEHHHHDHDEDCDCGCHEHEHHHHDHDEDCDCGCHEHEHHHHEHDEDCDCGCHEHEHHHHDHDEDCDCGCHEHEHHHHEHDEHCDCGCHGHHHHHHADEVFTSWGKETTRTFTADALNAALDELCDEGKYGVVLRAKGIVAGADGNWLHFDYVPGEGEVRTGAAGVIGRLCVIGSNLHEGALALLFGVN